MPLIKSKDKIHKWHKIFLNHWFAPSFVQINFAPRVLFIGYYLPLLAPRSLKKEKPYIFPVPGITYRI